jgi:hypothetical protein
MVSMMEQLRPGPSISGCLTWAKLLKDVADRTDWVSEVPAALVSDARAATPAGLEATLSRAGECGKAFSEPLSAVVGDGT